MAKYKNNFVALLIKIVIVKTQKLLCFEVDQSIRVEELTKDTIIGLANAENYYTIRLTVKAKRRIHEYFRRIGQPKKFAPSVFSAGIVFAILESKFRSSELVIDIEYPGYDLLIINFIKKYFPEMLIYFGIIGKKSPAHFAAYGVHKNKKTADAVAGVSIILNLIKNDPRAVTPPDKCRQIRSPQGSIF